MPPGSKNVSSSSSVIKNFCDHATNEEILKLNTLLARAIYATCSPLSMVENQHFKTFLKAIRPSYNPPTRYQISTSFLDKEFNLVQRKVKEKLTEATSLVLLSDGWTDINGISLINIIFSTPQPVFYRCIDSKTESHTGQYIANVLSNAMDEVGAEKVDALVTDNAKNMTLAWTLLKKKHPQIVTYGCIAHGINLLLKDLYSLPSVARCSASVKDIIKFFKNKHIAKQVLKEIHLSDNNKEIALITCVETRWGSMVQSIVSVLNNKDFLQKAILHKYIRPIIDARIRRYILDEDEFWPKVKCITDFTKPIADLIKALEGDTPLLSKVYPYMKKLDELFCDDKLDFLNNSEKIKAKEVFEHRKAFIHHPVQLSTYLLDPNERGSKMTEEEMNNAMDFIVDFASVRNYDMDKILSDLANYKAQAGPWSNRNIWRAAKNTDATVWWKGFFENQELSKVAIRILNFPPTSASCERNWKTYSLTKTKKRNRLTIERTNKLIMIKYNLQLLKNEDFQVSMFDNEKENMDTGDEEIEIDISTTDDSIVFDETDDEQIMDEEMVENQDDIDPHYEYDKDTGCDTDISEPNESSIYEHENNEPNLEENECNEIVDIDLNERENNILYIPNFFVLKKVNEEMGS